LATACLRAAKHSRGAAALGGNGGSLGYAGTGAIGSNQRGRNLNIYSGASGGIGSEYVTGGTIGANVATGSVSLTSGDPIQVTLAYSGSNLTETLDDLTQPDLFHDLQGN